MWKRGSIGTRLIIIYFLLVFIALAIVGVFIMQQLESYSLKNTKDSLTKVAQEGVLKSLRPYDSLEEYQQEIQTNIETWYSAVQEEIFVITKDFNVIASSNPNFVNRSAVEGLDENIIIKSMNGEIAESEGVLESQDISVLNVTFPVTDSSGEVTGVLYIRTDLTFINDTLDHSLLIFIQAMIIALAVTIILGILISRGITRPVNQLTKSAEAMSKGDFMRKVDIRSDDEIGRLGMAFNQMSEQLDKNMSEISEEKNKLEIVLKNMADGLIAVDESGNIIHINAVALDMFNISEEYAVNKNYDELIYEFCPQLVSSKIKEKLIDNDMYSAENFELNGSVYYARYEVIDKAESTEVSLIVVIQDITERQKLESMQKDFVANVSHELNTPLTTIKSYTETILDSEDVITDPEMLRRFLTVVDSEAFRMSRLVKDLLQLSRLESQREIWNKGVRNIVSLTSDVVLKNHINAENKNQQLNILFDETDEIFVYADADKIEQVLLNIISNSIKYTEKNGRIDVDIREKNDTVHVIVRDNGIGIAEKELPRLFERFYRVDKARSRSMGHGTGLGLSIAKQIIEEHDGTISINSKEGQGTTVTIVLPVVEGDSFHAES